LNNSVTGIRPPSQQKKVDKESDDGGYSDEGFDEVGADEDDDKKLQKLRKAIEIENKKA
jgi:hypothetical protein